MRVSFYIDLSVCLSVCLSTRYVLCSTGLCFQFTTHATRVPPAAAAAATRRPQPPLGPGKWSCAAEATGSAAQETLLCRITRCSWRRIDRNTLTRSTSCCFLASASSPPTSRPPPQPSRTSLGLNRSCCSAGAGELPIYDLDVRAVSHISDYL